MSREAFNQAATFFGDTVSHITPDQWEAPGLGVWNVRDLVGHTARAMLTVEQYATVGAGKAVIGTSDDVAERGREAGRALGHDPASAVQEIARRVVALVASLPDDHPIETPYGKPVLATYLRSRVTELTIHTMDLADAVGLSVEPPGESMRVTLYMLIDLARRGGVVKDVAFALTGRGTLPDGFSLLPT